MYHRTLIARVAHEVNRAYCAAIGDMSQLAWDDAPVWQRTSALNGVEAHLKNALTPEQSHESWMAEKVAAGWTWGPYKDPEAKKHPCITAYENLPLVQRAKDLLFKGVVEAFKADWKKNIPDHSVTMTSLGDSMAQGN